MAETVNKTLKITREAPNREDGHIIDPYSPIVCYDPRELTDIEKFLGLTSDQDPQYASRPARNLTFIPTTELSRVASDGNAGSVFWALASKRIKGFSLKVDASSWPKRDPSVVLPSHEGDEYSIPLLPYLQQVLGTERYILLSTLNEPQVTEEIEDIELELQPLEGAVLNMKHGFPSKIEELIERPTVQGYYHCRNSFELRRKMPTILQEGDFCVADVAQDLGMILARNDEIASAQDTGGKWDHQRLFEQRLAAHLIDHPDDDFLYIESATGSGKTEMQVHLCEEWVKAG